MKSTRRPLLGIAIVFVGCLCSAGLRAQAAASVWDGVYTDEQASRGSTLYREKCASCHGERLQGKHPTPALSGSSFKGNWNGQTLDALFEKIQTTMPADKPGQLSRLDNADILAFILKSNDFPDGKEELSSEATKLKPILFRAEREPK